MCGAEKTKDGYALPMYDSNGPEAATAGQKLGYNLLMWGKFKCRSLCLKFDNRRCEENYIKTDWRKPHRS